MGAQISKKIKHNNYLSNSYKVLTKAVFIHFFIILIEFSLILLQIIDIYYQNYKPKESNSTKKIFNPILLIIYKTDKISQSALFLILFILIILFDFLYFLTNYYEKLRFSYIPKIVINFLELFFFRLFTQLYFNFQFSLPSPYFEILLIITIIHILIIISNFRYNHLYYFTPDFIEYPYDEINSYFELYLLALKFILSIGGTTSTPELGKLCFILIIIFDVIFSFYLCYLMIYHSYLFMKNKFLNKTRLSFRLSETLILIILFFIQKEKIYSIFFIIIVILIIFSFTSFIYLLYSPFQFIFISRDRQEINLFDYLYILSSKQPFDFIIENQIGNHFDKCGICNLCEKYIEYKIQKYGNDNTENTILISCNEKKNNKKMDLFDLLYNESNSFLLLMKNLIKNYNIKGKNYLINNSVVYINLSFLIYQDYNTNINLALNEKLIFEYINNQNTNSESHKNIIEGIFLINEFISLGNNTLNLIKKILDEETKIIKAQQLYLLSNELKKIQAHKFTDNLLGNHKSDNDNSNNGYNSAKKEILICSIFYEELFNTILNNSQFPLRENPQPVEDFFNGSIKNDDRITIEFDVITNYCKIIRTGKNLFIHKNQNLYELFPFEFRQIQTKLFLEKIKNITKTYAEFKFIILKVIDNKNYYQLMQLKLFVLFNNSIKETIYLSGIYSFQYDTATTKTNLNNLNFNSDTNHEQILAISNPKFDQSDTLSNNNNYSFSNFAENIKNKGYLLNKDFSYCFTYINYNIYRIKPKKIRRGSVAANIKIEINNEDYENSLDEESGNSNIIKNLELIGETGSMTSVQTTTSSKDYSSIAIDAKKKQDKFLQKKGFKKLNIIIFIIIVLILIIVIIETILLAYLKNKNYQQNQSMIDIREFIKLYYKLLTSTFSVVCLPLKLNSSTCLNYLSFFNEYLNATLPNDNINLTTYVLTQNKILVNELINNKNNLQNLINIIGEEIYNNVINNEMIYIEIGKTSKSLYKNERKVKFSEAVSLLCNSFVLLNNNDNYYYIYPIYFLNKMKNPFDNIQNQNSISEFQEEIYTLILNYRSFYINFKRIIFELSTILGSKSNLINITIYISLNFNTVIFLILLVSITIYIWRFQEVIINSINYINLIINYKDDDYSFKEVFSTKIENLEIILNMYKHNPSIALQNINDIYNTHWKFLSKKQKENKINNNKEINNNSNKKNELENIPLCHQLITRKNYKSLKICKSYNFIPLVLVILILFVYIILLMEWIYFFSQTANVYILLHKKFAIERSTYQSLGLCQLMFFQNLTIKEISNYIGDSFNENNPSDGNETIILKDFYDNLQLNFELDKDFSKLGSYYKNLESQISFDCNILFNRFKRDKVLSELYEQLESDNVFNKLINICIKSKVTETKDFKSVFEKHLQLISDTITGIDDFSYDKLINSKNMFSLSKASFFFFVMTTNIMDYIIGTQHISITNQLFNQMNYRIIFTAVLFFVSVFIYFWIFMYFFRSKISNYFKQIFQLRKVFNITGL